MELKSLKEIKAMIVIAQKNWSDIESKMHADSSLGLSNEMANKKKRLESSLDDICNNLVMWLFHRDCSIIKRVCRRFLEKILKISEGLRSSYFFPGYNESYYIQDAIKMTLKPEEEQILQ